MSFKKILLVLIIILFTNNGLKAAYNEDMIEVGAVEQKSGGEMLEAGVVSSVKKPTVTPTFTPIPPTAVPTLKPKVTQKSTPKIVKKYIKPTAVPTPVPTATATPVMPPEFGIVSLVAEEIIIPSTPANYYGLASAITGEKRLRVVITLQNNGQGTANNTVAELKANNFRIAVIDPVKELGVIYPGAKTDLSYAVERLSGYEGPDSIKLLLKVKTNEIERELPLEVYAEPFNPNTVYIVFGCIIILIIIFMIIVLSGKRKKKTYSDFD